MKEHVAQLTMDDYRPAPFWFLNHRLEKPELLLQLKLMAQQGIKAFFVHPRAAFPASLILCGFVRS